LNFEYSRIDFSSSSSSSAYKLFKQAAELGHIEAKEELAFAHIFGVHLPMNFEQAKKYFDEGALVGSPKSHFVCQTKHSNVFFFRSIKLFSFLGLIFS